MQRIPHYMSVLHHGGKDKNFVEGDLGIIKYQTKSAGRRVDSFIKVAVVVFVKTLTIVSTARRYLLLPAVSFLFLLSNLHSIHYAIQSVTGLETPMSKVFCCT